MIRQNGLRSVAVSIRLLDSLIRITPHVTRKRDRETIFIQAEALRTGFQKGEHVKADQDVFDNRYAKLMDVLKVGQSEECSGG